MPFSSKAMIVDFLRDKPETSLTKGEIKPRFCTYEHSSSFPVREATGFLRAEKYFTSQSWHQLRAGSEAESSSPASSFQLQPAPSPRRCSQRRGTGGLGLQRTAVVPPTQPGRAHLGATTSTSLPAPEGRPATHLPSGTPIRPLPSHRRLQGPPPGRLPAASAPRPRPSPAGRGRPRNSRGSR